MDLDWSDPETVRIVCEAADREMLAEAQRIPEDLRPLLRQLVRLQPHLGDLHHARALLDRLERKDGDTPESGH